MNDSVKPSEGQPVAMREPTWLRHARQWILPLVVLLAGTGGAVALQRAKPKESRAPREKSARLVTASPLTPKSLRARVVGRGVVEPEREVVIVPEVSGKVVHVSKNLIAGGSVTKGEVLLRIDPRSYKQQVDQQQGALKNAELQVEVEKNQRELAAYESQVLGQAGQRTKVATREGHVQAAEAGVRAQQSAVASARLNLQRTVITAPFDATVVVDNVDVGQVVSPQSQVAHLIATSELRVEVSVPVEDLAMFAFPSEGNPGASAVVRQELPRGQKVEREGQVSRLVRKLDESTRRARVLVTVQNPFDPNLGLPLLPGAHVEVEIEGNQLRPLVAIDRKAVYDGTTIWLVDEESKLRRRTIQVVWSDRQRVYVEPEFEPNDRVVTTLLATPIDGLPVRVEAAPTASAKPESGEVEDGG